MSIKNLGLTCLQNIKYPYRSYDTIANINSFEVRKNKIINENHKKFEKILNNPTLFYNITKYLNQEDREQLYLASEVAYLTDVYLKKFYPNIYI